MRRRWIIAVCLALTAGAGLAQDRPTTRARASLADLNAQEEDLAARTGRNRAELARLLGAIQLFARDPPPALLADPREVKDAVRAEILIRAIAPALEARARALSLEAAQLAVERRRAAAANGDRFAAESAAADRRSRLDGAMTDAEALSPPSLRGPVGEPHAPDQAPRNLMIPASGPRTAGFGGRLADGARSQGWALQPVAGATVVSPAAAVVDYAGPLNGWGLVLILRAGGGCHMVLSGLGKILVSAGQSVAPGQTIGAMPNDGQASNGAAARELYFEVRMGGAPVDPARLMTGTPPKTASGSRTTG